MKVFEVQISGLNHAPYNPRRISDEQMAMLQASLSEFGFVDPIVVNRRTNIIVGGHQRAKAWESLGNTTIPIVYVDLDEAQERALNLALNKTGGEFDPEKLKDLIFEMKDLGFQDFDVTGFSAPELSAIIQPEHKDVEEDELPPIPLEARSKLGDLWILGRHKLLCGDATQEASYRTLMGNEKADCVFTDPPYNVGYEGKTKEALTIQNDQMSDEEFYQLLLDSFSNLALYSKPGAGIYIAHADSEGLNFRTAMVAAGWLQKQCLIWVKNVMVMGRQDYQWQHEPILYGWLPGASHNWFGGRDKKTTLFYDKPQRNGEHPTMKPIPLVADCIQNSTIEGHMVLDCFGGSGTTLIACEQTGRVCRTMELDPIYVDVILSRWEKLTGLKAELYKGDPNEPKSRVLGKVARGRH